MTITIFVILFIVIALAVAVVKEANAKKVKKRVELQYGADESYASTVDSSFVAINFNRQQVVLGNGKYESAYNFDQIVSVEIVLNENTVTKTNRGSQVLGAAVGAIALGGIGALVGGLTGSTSSKSKLKSLVLKVIVDDQRQPVYSIPFLKAPGTGFDQNGMVAKQRLQTIERMHAQFVVAMRRAQEQKLAPTFLDVAPPTLGGDQVQQLEKLWELKSRGILSEDEFTAQKQLMLSTSTKAALQAAPSPRVIEAVLSRTVTAISHRDRLEALKAVRELRGIGLVEGMKLVESFPAILFSNISPEAADSIRQKLEAAGVTVRIE